MYSPRRTLCLEEMFGVSEFRVGREGALVRVTTIYYLSNHMRRGRVEGGIVPQCSIAPDDKKFQYTWAAGGFRHTSLPAAYMYPRSSHQPDTPHSLLSLSLSPQGGHAAMPHLDIDPIIAAAQTISSLQSLVAREISPLGGCWGGSGG